MSLWLFVYACMICGAWSGLIGWVLGHALFSGSSANFGEYLYHQTTMGLSLGLAVAFGLSLLDAIFNLSLRQPRLVIGRVFFAVAVGVVGSAVGSMIGAALFYQTSWNIFFVIGWSIVGLLVGASISAGEVMASLISKKNLVGAFKKFSKCVLGGSAGGVAGGIIALTLSSIAQGIFANKNVESLWSPTAFGFVALGACIGLLVGLAQVLLKEAWIRVEAGFRPGRELILTKEKTSIGRAEGSDIALFGDSAVERTHALIVAENGHYFLEDLNTPGGTLVNDVRAVGRMPLKAGDVIRAGNSALRFNERTKPKN